jgi:hypothetical protein
LDQIKKQALAAALSNVLAYEGIGVCRSSWQRLTRWKAEQDRLAKQARPIGGVRKRQGKRRP